jgi:hypothetical protein
VGRHDKPPECHRSDHNGENVQDEEGSRIHALKDLILEGFNPRRVSSSSPLTTHPRSETWLLRPVPPLTCMPVAVGCLTRPTIPWTQVQHKTPFKRCKGQPVRSHPRYPLSVTLGGFSMTRKDRLALYGRVGLILGSFAIIGGVVAEPLVRHVWPSRLTVAQR